MARHKFILRKVKKQRYPYIEYCVVCRKQDWHPNHAGFHCGICHASHGTLVRVQGPMTVTRDLRVMETYDGPAHPGCWQSHHQELPSHCCLCYEAEMKQQGIWEVMQSNCGCCFVRQYCASHNFRDMSDYRVLPEETLPTVERALGRELRPGEFELLMREIFHPPGTDIRNALAITVPSRRKMRELYG